MKKNANPRELQKRGEDNVKKYIEDIFQKLSLAGIRVDEASFVGYTNKDALDIYSVSIVIGDLRISTLLRHTQSLHFNSNEDADDLAVFANNQSRAASRTSGFICSNQTLSGVMALAREKLAESIAEKEKALAEEKAMFARIVVPEPKMPDFMEKNEKIRELFEQKHADIPTWANGIHISLLSDDAELANVFSGSGLPLYLTVGNRHFTVEKFDADTKFVSLKIVELGRER